MSNSGIVEFLSREIKAITTRVSERFTQAEEHVLPNQQVLLANNGPVDGGIAGNFDLEEDSFSSGKNKKEGFVVSEEVEEEVALIQRELVEDEEFDPSQLDATAAGGEEIANAENEGNSLIEIDYLKPEMTPENGFETKGINNNDTPIINLFEAELILQPAAILAAEASTEPVVRVTDHFINLAVADNIIAENASAPVNGTFVITTPEGLASLTVGSQSILEAELLDSGTTNISIATDQGNLTINGFDVATGTVNYSYQQQGIKKTHSVTDDGDASNGEEFDTSVVDQISITVTDDTSVSSAPGVLDILITDSLPEAIDNFEQISHNQSWLVDNVIANFRSGSDTAADDELGADGAKLASVSFGDTTKEFLNPGDILQIGTNKFIQLDADNGKLYIQDNGQYWYNNTSSISSTEIKDTFTYQLIDGDGDLSHANLTITHVLGDVNTGEVFV